MKRTEKESQRARPSALTPILIIVVAIVLAAGAGYFLTRDRSVMSSAPVGAVVALQGGHSIGPQKAPLTLVEFGDYECPTCGIYNPIVHEVLNRFPQIRFEFHHFPLVNLHRNALAAATAAEAAGDQNHFWEMHDLLFQHQKDWENSAAPNEIFIAYAAQLGLDTNQFQRDLQSPAIGQRITEDVTRALDAKVPATPTFLINGQIVNTPKTVEEFTQLIQSRLSGK